MYKTLTKSEGARFFQKSLTIILSNKENSFPNPFVPRELRYRCLFKNGSCSNLVAYLYLKDKEIATFKCLNPLPDKIYLYGAYNQINVCQMQALGNIKEIGGDKKNEIISFLTKRFNGEFIECDNFFPKLDQDDKNEGLKSLSLSGKLYYFEPISFAYDEYERG